MAIDPICGMTVEEETAEHFCISDDQVFYFCSQKCKNRYLSPAAGATTRQGIFRRFLARLARATAKDYGRTPPGCH